VSYDHWKTTDPAELGSTLPKSTRLQCAADDAYVIGETIEALDSLLERFYEQHGEDLSADLCRMIPEQSKLKALAKKVYAFAHSLEPVED
jgi:hypothetical protein